MTSGKGAPAKPALRGEAGATGAVRTSGQLGPKSHSAVGDGEARSAGFGEAPQQAVFRVLAAGQNLKNVQVWPHLPCLPVSAYRIAIKEACHTFFSGDTLLLSYYLGLVSVFVTCYRHGNGYP